MSAVIEVDRVTKEFQLGQLSSLWQTLQSASQALRGTAPPARQPFKALDDVSFSVSEGEVVGIIGHNGAGKSTLLKLLANISQPSTGKLRVRGRVAPLIEVGAGMVPDMTGRENIHLNAAILGMSRADIRRKFDEIVAFSELEAFIDTPVKRYSSGMQVKLGFAIATSVDADVLIVDEVLAVGDLAFQRKCFDRMQALIKAQGRTMLVVSHNIRQIERICTRVLLLDHGKVLLDGGVTDGCNRFLNINDQAISRSQVQHRHQQETGEVELLGVDLADLQGRPITQVTTGQGLRVTMNYRALAPLKKVNFGVGVHTTDFIYLATHNWVEEMEARDVAPGPVSVTFVIPKVPLLPRKYSLRVGVSLGERLVPIYYAEGVAHFEVVSPQMSGSVAAEAGFFGIDGHWEMTAPGSFAEPSTDGAATMH